MLKTYQSANAQIDDWVGFVFEAIENSPPTDLTDTIANDLKDVQEQLEIFDRNSAMLADRVAVALRRCDNVRIETEKRQREKELETVAN